MTISALGVKWVWATVGVLAALEQAVTPALPTNQGKRREDDGGGATHGRRVWQVCDPSAVDSWGPERASELAALVLDGHARRAPERG